MRPRERRAFTLIELVIVTLILAIALVPMHYAFLRGQKAVVQSRLAYMAMQVARETAQELRQLPFDRLEELDNWDKGSVPVTGALFGRTAAMRAPKGGDQDPNKVAAQGPQYPEEYNRILVRLKVDKLRDTPDQPDDRVRLKQVTIEVVWEEKGIADREARQLYRYGTIVGRHSVDPEVTP